MVVWLDAGLACRLVLPADVDLRRGIVTDQHGREPERAQLRRIRSYLRADARGERGAVDLRGSHGASVTGRMSEALMFQMDVRPTEVLDRRPPERELWLWIVVLFVLAIAGGVAAWLVTHTGDG